VDFKHCKFYNKAIEQEHCPFQCVCTDDCYFTRIPLDEYQKVEELSSEIKDLQRVEKEQDIELDNYSESIRELEEENKDLSDIIIQLLKDKKIKNADKYIGTLDNLTQRYIKIRL